VAIREIRAALDFPRFVSPGSRLLLPRAARHHAQRPRPFSALSPPRM